MHDKKVNIYLKSIYYKNVIFPQWSYKFRCDILKTLIWSLNSPENNRKIHSEKRRVIVMGGVENLLPGIKMYYLATVTETFWYWYRKKSMEKNRVQIRTQIPLAIQDRIQMTLYWDGKRRNYSIDWAGIST